MTLYSDKTWVFDQSVRAQGPIYIIMVIYSQITFHIILEIFHSTFA